MNVAIVLYSFKKVDLRDNGKNASEISRAIAKQQRAEAVPTKHLPKDIQLEFKRSLGISYIHALNEQFEDIPAIIDNAQKYLTERSREFSRWLFLIMRTMRRRALILHYVGDVTNCLNGISVDVKNIRHSLRSDYGGSWKDSEITVVPNNWFVNDLKCYFNENVESTYYYLISYTGHGSYVEGKDPVYWMNNQEFINNTWLQNCIGGKAAAMLISDSCQVIESYRRRFLKTKNLFK